MAKVTCTEDPVDRKWRGVFKPPLRGGMEAIVGWPGLEWLAKPTVQARTSVSRGRDPVGN